MGNANCCEPPRSTEADILVNTTGENESSKVAAPSLTQLAAPEPAAAAEELVPLKTPRLLTIDLKKADEKDKLGLGVKEWTQVDETVPTKLYIHEVKADGVVAKWNAESPASEQIHPEQLICAVNSATTCKDMFSELREKSEWTLKIEA